jgi:predicted Zn-dependent peptidase
MRKSIQLLAMASLMLWLFAGNVFAQKQYTFETVPGDALNARIYTLDNGLKVYMTVYKDKPRIQAYVAVAVGSKNDPKETTGLAHYFEHMMFKGTNHFGTANWTKEKSMIATIDSLFEIYRTLKDESQRKDMYHVIDSISYEASKLAIPNEYDKLMSIIGSDGTNAYTSLEQTVYVENIPSNQLENWATIQSDRFSNPVLRLFHTELETIYEEKNMTLTNDGRKVYTALLEGLFPNHTYGTQTTIGLAEHIKNPSMANIRKFFDTYYVPNNMAICLSGDFDPDYAIRVIDAKFGGMKNKPIPPFTFKKEDPIKEPVVKNVVGQDAENISIAYRFGGVNSVDQDMTALISMILTNGNVGLIDLNINQKQKALSAYAYPNNMKDYSALVLGGKPKTGQTLEELRDLLLAQVELLKKGDFPDWLMEAAINDLKLSQIKEYESNEGRADAFVNSFVMGENWKDAVSAIDRLSKITKEQVVKFANETLANNYVIVYKRKGKDESVAKVKKPKITPIVINRDLQSDFLKSIEANKVADIQPVFIDFNKDLTKFNIKSSIPVLYKENTENKTFDLYYVFEMGSNNNKKFRTAANYLKYLGTSTMTPEKVKEEFFRIGCSFNVSSSADQTYVSLSGLSENMEKAVKLLESMINDPQPNQEAFDNLIKDIIKQRADAKLNQRSIFSALSTYGRYGKNSPNTNLLSEKELKALTPAELLDIIKSLSTYQHHIMYYGSQSTDELTRILNNEHKVASQLKPVPVEVKFAEQETKKNIVYHVQYDAKQATLMMMAKGGLYNAQLEPTISLYNEYFGGSMNSIVFQELREARSLAYTAMSMYQSPSKLDRSYYNISYIATQNDKVIDALNGLSTLLSDMPESDKAFKLAKDGIIQKLRTERITKSDILWAYEGARKLGLSYDDRKDVFEKVQTMSFSDIKNFQNQYVKGKTHTYLLLGNKEDIDFKAVKKWGKIKTLTLEEIFGY